MSEIIASVLLIGVMVVAIFSLSGNAYWTDYSPGPAFMPYWIAGLGCLVAVLLTIQSIRSNFAMSEEETDFSDIGKAGTVIAMLCVLLLIIPWVGMLIGSTMLILAILVGLQRRPLWPSLLSATITGAIVYGVFEHWLRVDMPHSPFGI